MAKKCPLGGYALYLDCLECEEKLCKKRRDDHGGDGSKSSSYGHAESQEDVTEDKVAKKGRVAHSWQS